MNIKYCLSEYRVFWAKQILSQIGKWHGPESMDWNLVYGWNNVTISEAVARVCLYDISLAADLQKALIWKTKQWQEAPGFLTVRYNRLLIALRWGADVGHQPLTSSQSPAPVETVALIYRTVSPLSHIKVKYDCVQNDSEPEECAWLLLITRVVFYSFRVWPRRPCC